MPNKLFYVCLDGLGDDPLEELGGRTPVEAAATPFLDDLARRGRQGLVHTVGPDIAPESDIAVFAILGYDPREEHPGRGVLEAIGSGMAFEDGSLAHRVNFATIDGGTIIDRRVGRDLPSAESQALAAEVTQGLDLPGVTAELKATIEHRGALVLRPAEGRLSANVSNTDPAYAKEGTLGVALETYEDRPATCEPLDDTDEAARSAELTNLALAQAGTILEASDVNGRRRAEGRLPANLVLTRDAGDHIPKLQPIADRFGPSWGCFVEMPVERGIAMVLGMGEVPAPMPEDDHERYEAWAGLAAEAIDGYDALYVHIKGPDVPAHDGRGDDKRAVCETIDEAFFGTLLSAIGPDRALFVVTADHSTSCARKAHTADAVPLVVAGPGVAADGTESFSERAAAEGSIGTIGGVDILPRVVGLLSG